MNLARALAMGDFEEDEGEEEEEEEMDTSGGEVDKTWWHCCSSIKINLKKHTIMLLGEAEAPEENLQEPVDALRVAGWGT